ncbi:PLP-dependent aminotransferase family protein [Pseudoroseicyclus tamaricis]|uniref:PLP-dependent aminotransferase family protein n=1 Tax=Pseudoroseicyclus tamaricis TaxID=2705421 RepID=A0A6B2JV35_9RHOB|nr:PLP-dependent aminotransferase family protein [Pseudoroseicyclus tamaricis]NDV00044.1 PLP-dependent aminotransferase family protein [Pseudoroseicyclus tamaricis]
MSGALTLVDKSAAEPIQAQLRRSLITAIQSGRLSPGQRMMPSRQLAQQVGIARNTVTLVYDELVARGYLEPVPRKGYFVAEVREAGARTAAVAPGQRPNWNAKLRQRPARLRHIVKPSNWQDYAYPFIYGQVDPKLFPYNIWRACSRDALGRGAIDWWSADRAVDDDPMLVEEIRNHILPEKGIYAEPDEILITLGIQHGIYLLGQLLVRPGARVGVETPGYPDARHIFDAAGAELVEMAVDEDGARMDHPGPLDVMMITPTHQCPTMVTMSAARREEVLARARADDAIVIEDDYEGETTFTEGLTSLKSADRDGRVAYLGTLSKVLAPGVRLGFMVADRTLVAEARWLRRLINRSAPLNNQRTAAIFLAEGHYLGLIRTIRSAHAARWKVLAEGVDRHLPGFRRSAGTGGSSVWLECPPEVEAGALAARAAELGVLVESGDPFVRPQERGRFIRLGLAYIDEGLIDAGLRRIAEAARDVAGRPAAPPPLAPLEA